MSQVPLYTLDAAPGRIRCSTLDPQPSTFEMIHSLQGYLAHKKPPPPRTLQQNRAYGAMVVLVGGGGFL